MFSVAWNDLQHKVSNENVSKLAWSLAYHWTFQWWILSDKEFLVTKGLFLFISVQSRSRIQLMNDSPLELAFSQDIKAGIN